MYRSSSAASKIQICNVPETKYPHQTRVGELSATLIKEFQYRGEADHSKEVRKAFVSAFLTAEEKVIIL